MDISGQLNGKPKRTVKKHACTCGPDDEVKMDARLN